MKYLVTIDYNHKKGFEMSEDMVVVAPDQEGAISYLSGLLSSRASVKSIARTRAISIEPIESPAPTDWGKELAKIQDLREKAKEYLSQMSEKYGPIAIENSLVIEIAESVQKAIAGGTGK